MNNLGSLRSVLLMDPSERIMPGHAIWAAKLE